jgi:hypothetical protein
MYTRFIEDHLKKTTMPVIMINGARQVGKSNLVKKVFSNTHRYLTLYDPKIL